MRLRIPVLVLLSSVLGGVTSCGRTPSPPARPVAPASARIEWARFTPEAFARARAEHRLVLVDVGIEGCTACRWMHEDTYRDPAVLTRLRDHFVTVSVDADVEPDLGERYERWGWPATIVLTPEAEQVVAIQGNVRPRNFVPILDDLIQRKKTGTLGQGRTAVVPSEAPAGALADLCSELLSDMDKSQDSELGGWRFNSPVKSITGERVRLSFFRARVHAEPARLAHALRTLDGFRKVVDPVWGGVFVASRTPDYESPIVEKRTQNESDALREFAEAYAATGEARWLEAMHDVDRYMQSFMLAPDGTFYATQEDDAPSLPKGMTAVEYYRLPDAERRRYGIPPIDHGVYTSQNGVAIEAYATAYEATGDTAWLAVATRAAEALLAARLQPDGTVSQAARSNEIAKDDRRRPFLPQATVYLSAQAELGLALVALHRATGASKWLDHAERLATAMRKKLEDGDAGGFFASTARSSVPQYKPFDTNTQAARFLLAVHRYRPHLDLERSAERALRAASGSARPYGLYVLALEELLTGPVDLTIVGKKDDPAAMALHAAAVRAYDPRKIVHFDSAKKYPYRGRAELYACTADLCSSPVSDPRLVASTLATTSSARLATVCAARTR